MVSSEETVAAVSIKRSALETIERHSGKSKEKAKGRKLATLLTACL